MTTYPFELSKLLGIFGTFGATNLLAHILYNKGIWGEEGDKKKLFNLATKSTKWGKEGKNEKKEDSLSSTRKKVLKVKLINNKHKTQ